MTHRTANSDRESANERLAALESKVRGQRRWLVVLSCVLSLVVLAALTVRDVREALGNILVIVLVVTAAVGFVPAILRVFMVVSPPSEDSTGSPEARE